MTFLPIGRKPGRPIDDDLALVRSLFPEWSERTIARYTVAMRRLRLMGYDSEQTCEVIRRVTRRNGTLNIAKLDDYTVDLSAMYIVRLEQQEQRRAS